MMKRIRATGGLSTDPSHLADPEALRIADNVLLHRPGLIQPRFGLGDTTGIAARSVTRRPIALVPFDGDMVAQSRENTTYSLERGSVATVYSSAVAPPDTNFRGSSSFAEMRGSLYLTTSTGVQKLLSASSSSLYAAGVVTDYALPSIGAGLRGTADRYAVKNNSIVAYRYCWVNTDANGYVRRSAPSPRFSVSNSDATYYFEVPLGRIYLPDGIIAGDVFELYRTVSATPYTSDPGDEMFLAYTHTVTSAQVSAGYLSGAIGVDSVTTIVDRTPDDMLGASLYTNVSRETILAANERPPLAQNLAPWARCLWFGNTQERHTMLIEPRVVYDTSATYAITWRDGIHYSNDRTGDTHTNTTIDNVTRVGGMKVGQYITFAGLPTDADTHFSAATKVATITTTITIVNFANITGGGTPDTITFVGIPGSNEEFTSISWGVTTAFGSAAIGASNNATATNLASAINQTFDGRRASITATANANVVTVVDDDGHGVEVTITETIPGAVTKAYSMTIDKAALTTTATIALRLHDYITVAGTEFYFGGLGSVLDIPGGQAGLYSDITDRIISLDNARAGGQNLDDMCKLLVVEIVKGINNSAVYSGSPALRAYADDVVTGGPMLGFPGAPDASASAASILLIREYPGTSAITFSHSPSRPAGGFRSSSDFLARARPGRLWYSKPDEPEAVPPSNFIDIGNVNADILALVPLRNALLVWKEDGLFRITGNGPTFWNVDEIDLTMRLLAPQATCVLNNVCYAWTSRGVARATEVGTEIISNEIGDRLREIQRLLPLDETGSKRGFWMTAHERHGLVILGTGDNPTDDVTTAWYVFHTSTQRWAPWPIVSRCAAYDPATDRMVHSPNIDAWSVLFEREDEDATASYRDASLSGLAGTVASLVVTIATSAFGGFTPAAGDVLVDGSSVKARVESVEVSGANQLLTISTALTGTSFTWHQGYAITVVWSAQALPGFGSRWTEGHIHMMTSDSAYVSTFPLQIGGMVEHNTSAQFLTMTVTPTDAEGSPKYGVYRYGQPRDIVRAATMSPAMIITTAGALWTLAELDLHFLPQSQRVRR